MEVKVGTVKWFSKPKGFGFITNSDDVDVFVHYTAIPGHSGNRNLNEGDRVEYVEEITPKGLRAASVLSFQRGATT